MRYHYQCGYCGVAEHEIGSFLEIDHFRPKIAGGTDDLDNLVYCCSTCNRTKNVFWSENELNRLLHPILDNVSAHIYEQEDGFLSPLTPLGAFHVERLRLNRPALLILRQKRLQEQRMREAVPQIQSEVNSLLQQILEEERLSIELKEKIMRLLERMLKMLREQE
ncbi:MAG: HNH endonuclease [Fimbriimonadia bacterium]|nr:HNH endonuclease [Fimbriimonadia bacterium]